MMYAGFRDAEEDVPSGEMTEKEILELCKTDFSSQIDEMLSAAKRDFVRSVKSEVIDYIVNVTVAQRERSRRSSVQSDKVPEARSRASTHEESINEQFTDEIIYEDNMIIEEEEAANEIVDDFPGEVFDNNSPDDVVGENLDEFMAVDSENIIGELSGSGIIDEFDGTLPPIASPVESQGFDEEESDFLGFGDSQAFD